MAEFISENPFTEGLRRRNLLDDQRDLSAANLATKNLAFDETGRKSGEEQGRDIVTRRTVAETPQQPGGPTTLVGGGTVTQQELPPVGAAPPRETSRGFQGRLAQNLATVPGGGAQASANMAASIGAEEAKEEQFLEIAVSNPDAAEEYARINGLPVDDNMRRLIRNRKAMAAIAGLLDAAKRIYPGAHNAVVRAQWLDQQLEKLGAQASQGGVDEASLQGGMMEGAPTPVLQPRFAPRTVTLTGQTPEVPPVPAGIDPAAHADLQAAAIAEDPNAPTGFPRIGVFDPNDQTITPTEFSGYTTGTGGATSATERIIANIMQEDGTLTYAEAASMARRSPNASAEELQRERLALQAAKNEYAFRTDPTGTLEKWRIYYGLTPDPSIPAPAPAAPPAAAASPYPDYPDAKQAQDGNWYVQRNGQWQRIDQ